MKQTSLFKKTIGTGPDLVLLHGWGMHSGIWESLAQKLQKAYRVTMIDLPGFGDSPWQGEKYNLSNLLEMMLPHMPERATYLGWSARDANGNIASRKS